MQCLEALIVEQPHQQADGDAAHLGKRLADDLAEAGAIAILNEVRY